uniref:Uncharacterized protein n=1 Tax=Heterorhabditis bacteriophora TaxID=37862 RepID=A0A1I7XTV6_HETBA
MAFGGLLDAFLAEKEPGHARRRKHDLENEKMMMKKISSVSLGSPVPKHSWPFGRDRKLRDMGGWS